MQVRFRHHVGVQVVVDNGRVLVWPCDSMNVEVEQFEEDPETGMYSVYIAVLVDRDNQKAIVIGKAGERLKKISTEARLDMEKLFDTKVFLKVWVKVKSGWADDIRFLNELGM